MTKKKDLKNNGVKAFPKSNHNSNCMAAFCHYFFVDILKGQIYMAYLIDCCAKFATGIKCSNRHRSKSMRVTKLFFCQIDPPMSASFWQKNRLYTQILFGLCEHFSPVANFAQQSILQKTNEFFRILLVKSLKWV